MFLVATWITRRIVSQINKSRTNPAEMWDFLLAKTHICQSVAISDEFSVIAFLLVRSSRLSKELLNNDFLGKAIILFLPCLSVLLNKSLILIWFLFVVEATLSEQSKHE